jgi:hypothetical protein
MHVSRSVVNILSELRPFSFCNYNAHEKKQYKVMGKHLCYANKNLLPDYEHKIKGSCLAKYYCFVLIAISIYKAKLHCCLITVVFTADKVKYTCYI